MIRFNLFYFLKRHRYIVRYYFIFARLSFGHEGDQICSRWVWGGLHLTMYATRQIMQVC